ncbi:MAG TPA: hypothetical protein VER55_14075 [Ardenticatenaceae bacterium]|nr:hypothetical protein [Ardenticatenaceae bacterium]
MQEHTDEQWPQSEHEAEEFDEQNWNPGEAGRDRARPTPVSDVAGDEDARETPDPFSEAARKHV